MNNVQDLDFAYKIRHALNEQLEAIPPQASERLASARKIALSRKKNDAPLRALASRKVLAGHMGNFFNDSFANEPLSWLGRIGLLIPVVVLIFGLVGIFQYEQQERIKEAADMDVAMLTDDLPLTAYADHGFNAYLAKRAE